MVAIQANLKAPKNQVNAFGKYKYRSCEDILEAVKPLLAKEGLYQNITDEIIEVGGKNYVKSTVTVYDGEDSISSSAIARESVDKKGTDDAQQTGATSSYSRKYCLNAIWGIDDQKDADATNTHGKDSPMQNSQPIAPRANGTSIHTPSNLF